jgi:phospho-N-acetylmuramoyl-pentapeptide-transferase
MLYWFFQHYSSLLEQFEIAAAGDSRTLVTLRAALATMMAFVLALAGGPVAIRWLKQRVQEKVKSDSAKLNELQAGKQATPTMGGLFITLAIVGSVLLFGDLTSLYVLASLMIIISFAALGAIDDWTKFSTTHNGIKPRTKFLWQIGFTFVILLILSRSFHESDSGFQLVIPIGKMAIPLGSFFFLWGVLVITGTSNAVNLTDGLDGLASGCMIFVCATLMVVSYLAGHHNLAQYLQIPYVPGSGELTVVLGAVLGSVLGFLWFNCYPASIFMGDTGSLPLGAILGYVALVIHQEILLAIAGGMLVLETLSVMLQVGYFKMTRKRILACSPLHNHYLFQGMPEHKIVVRFWIASAVFAILSLITLKIE